MMPDLADVLEFVDPAGDILAFALLLARRRVTGTGFHYSAETLLDRWTDDLRRVADAVDAGRVAWRERKESVADLEVPLFPEA